ncbi:MAG: matrixin family metalloprotease, partial [Chthoniobacter sp.]|nr:matrixin family metalloprotease [Chthoniobacter sp.]
NADAGVTGVTAYGWGNYDTLDLGNSTTLTVVASNESDQVGNNSSVTISGSCDVIGAGSGASITASGYEDGVTVASNGTVSLNGASDTATATGTDSVVYANGTSDVVDLTGTSDIASLSSGDIGYGNGTSDWVTANGTNDVISLGGTLDLGTLGSGDTGYAFGNSDTLDANGTGSVISLQGTSDIAALSSSNTAYASGVSDVVNGNGGSDIVDLTGVSDIANLSASDTGYGNGTDDTVYANGANDIVSLAGSSDTGWLTSGDTGYGQSTATDDTFDASGTGITVAASSATVDLATNTQANLFGSSDNTVLSTGDTFGAYGGSNTITAVADTDVTVGETGGAFDTIIDNGDTQGQATADGGQSGIWPNANAALNLDGSSNSVFLATDDDLRAVGGGNTIYAGSDDNVTIANTGGAFDSVYVSGDTGGQATVDGTDTSGIYPGANTATNVYGSSNTINLATGDDLRATGGANTISAGADDNVTIAGTNGAYDSVYVSGDTGGQATVDGTDTSGIYPGAGTQVNLYGHSDTIDLATQDTLNVNGSRDVVNGSDDHVDLYGSYDDVYGNSDQVYATSGDDDFTSGSGDSDSGSGFDVGGVGGSSWSSYGLVAGATKAVKVVAQYDLSQGDTSAAASAIAGWNEAQQAIAAASDPDVSAPSSFESGSWAGSAVTWSFATGTGTDAAPLSGSIEAQYQGAIEQALQTWANVTGLTFQQVSDSPSADIRIGWGSFDTNDSGVIGLTSYSASDGAMQAGVIIRLEDPAEDSLVGNTDGSFAYSGTDVGLYQLALHEIGHALGLAESSDPNSVMFPELGAANTTLDGTDIADIQALYDPSNPSGNSSTALLAQAIASCSAPTSSTAVSLPITPAVPTMTLAAATAG